MSSEKAASVLSPSGRLCVFWSAGHHPDDLADALSVVYHRVLPHSSPPVMIGYAANKAVDPTADFGVVMDALRSCDKLAGHQMRGSRGAAGTPGTSGSTNFSPTVITWRGSRR